MVIKFQKMPKESWPSSSNVVRTGATNCAFMNEAPTSASAVDAAAFLIIFAITDPFMRALSLFTKHWNPLALLLACGATRQAMSLSTVVIMLLAL